MGWMGFLLWLSPVQSLQLFYLFIYLFIYLLNVDVLLFYNSIAMLYTNMLI